MIKIKTDYPFCYDSADYKEPCGSAHDYHTNPLFIDRALSLFRKKCNVLDLGCANGTMIVDFINKGHNAIGIDGSDYGVKNKTGGWGSHPDNFFNADICKPFNLTKDFEFINLLGLNIIEEPLEFDIITAWEFLEHIAESDLPQLITNIKNHLKDTTSLCFFSIALFESGEYHRNVKTESWWRDFFTDNGFVIYEDFMKWWTLKEWVRQDENPDKRFHIIVGLK